MPGVWYETETGVVRGATREDDVARAFWPPEDPADDPVVPEGVTVMECLVAGVKTDGCCVVVGGLIQHVAPPVEEESQDGP